MALREKLAVNDKVPDFAVLVRVEEVFYHCGKAGIRSKLWELEAALSTEGLFKMNKQCRLYDEQPEV